MAIRTPDLTFRDYATDGVPSSGDHEPIKSEIRELLNRIDASAGIGAVTVATKAELDLIIDKDDNAPGFVLGDSTAANNGYYAWDDGGASWVKLRDLPDTIANVTLGGTANAQTGTVVTGVNPAGVLVYFAVVGTDNTGVMTLAIEGEAARDVVNAAGNALTAGEWTGTVQFFLNSGGDYQLINDAGAAASAAQSATDADTAKSLAELAQAAAEAAASSVAPTEFPNIATAEALTPASAPDFIRTAGYATAGDGGGALYKKAASEPAHAGKFSITLDDSVTVVWYELAEDVSSVKMFGATGDGSTDDTSAISAALSAISSTGSVLCFPPGTYNVSSELVVSSSGEIYGYGTKSVIRTTSATANVFRVTAQFVTIRDIAIESSVTRTDGIYLDVESTANRFRLANFVFSDAINGIRTAATATCTIENGYILDSVATSGVPIRVDGGFDVTISNVLTDQSGEVFSALYITECSDITLDRCQFINGGQCIYADIASTKVLASLWATNTFFDNSVRGIYLNANGGSIVRALFDQCWFSSHTADGALITASGGGSVDGVDFQDCHFFLNALEGISVTGGSSVKNVRVDGCSIAGNGGGGVSIASGVTDFIIHGNRIGNSHGFGANNTGISLAGTNDNYIIDDNDLRGNTTSALSGHTTNSATKVVSDNIGFISKSRGVSASLSPDGSGLVSITHGMDITPSNATLVAFGGNYYHVQPTAFSSTTITVKVFDAAGAAVTTGSLFIYWEAS